MMTKIVVVCWMLDQETPVVESTNDIDDKNIELQLYRTIEFVLLVGEQ